MPGPRTIVPPASFVAHGVAALAEGAAGPQLQKHGGPVIQAVEVVPIYWGAAWSDATHAPLATQLDGFFDFILTSTLMDLLSEYGTADTPIQHGSRPASASIPDSEPDAQVTDAQIQQALQGWIADGTVPATTANTLYFIYFPPNVVVVDQNGDQSCGTMCGYHSHIDNAIFYAVIPYVSCNGCTFPGDFLDTLTEVSSHELCEAITDPTLSTWWDPTTGNEIGDICNRQTTRLGGFLIQTEWSNNQGTCVAPQ